MFDATSKQIESVLDTFLRSRVSNRIHAEEYFEYGLAGDDLKLQMTLHELLHFLVLPHQIKSMEVFNASRKLDLTSALNYYYDFFPRCDYWEEEKVAEATALIKPHLPISPFRRYEIGIMRPGLVWNGASRTADKVFKIISRELN